LPEFPFEPFAFDVLELWPVEPWLLEEDEEEDGAVLWVVESVDSEPIVTPPPEFAAGPLVVGVGRDASGSEPAGGFVAGSVGCLPATGLCRAGFVFFGWPLDLAGLTAGAGERGGTATGCCTADGDTAAWGETWWTVLETGAVVVPAEEGAAAWVTGAVAASATDAPAAARAAEWAFAAFAACAWRAARV
jgi:hypothetical protein